MSDDPDGGSGSGIKFLAGSGDRDGPAVELSLAVDSEAPLTSAARGSDHTDPAVTDRIIHLATNHSCEFVRVDLKDDPNTMKQVMWDHFKEHIKDAYNITHVENRDKVQIELSRFAEHARKDGCTSRDRVNYHLAGPQLWECPSCMRHQDWDPKGLPCFKCEEDGARKKKDKDDLDREHNKTSAVLDRGYTCVLRSLPVLILTMFANIGLLLGAIFCLIIAAGCWNGETTYVLCGRGGCRAPAPCPTSHGALQVMVAYGVIWISLNIFYLVVVFWQILSDDCAKRVQGCVFCMCPPFCDACPWFRPCDVYDSRMYGDGFCGKICGDDV